MRLEKLDKLEDIIRRIIDAYEPQKVILFGSCARGDFVESSDIDLIVITETDKPFIKRLKDSAYIIPDAGVDILIYTPDEIRDFLEKGSAFVENALREGKILYEKGS